MNKLDKDYLSLLQDILDNGVEKKDRTGTGTISVFGRQIRHSMKDGFPLLTTKKIHFKSVVSELLWFLQGRTDLKWLLEQGNTIWVGDCWKRYINEFRRTCPKCPEITQEEFINKIKTDDEFAKTWGSLGRIYGHQWRGWSRVTYNDENRNGFYNPIDQIANLINDLKTNPDSRRLIVNSWNVGELDQMLLPPCHYSFQVYTRELDMEERWQMVDLKPNMSEFDWANKYCDDLGVPKRVISLMFNMRSNDVPLGLPFNIASYGLLLEIIAKMVNMVPDELIGNLGDCHIYTNQIDGIKEQLTREPYPLPKLAHLKSADFYKSLSESLSLFTHLESIDFVLENYQSHPTIKMPLSN